MHKGEHRPANDGIEDVRVGEVVVGDRLPMRAGEVVPVDGVSIGRGDD
jgi:cation transport ATPase